LNPKERAAFFKLMMMMMMLEVRKEKDGREKLSANKKIQILVGNKAQDK
jgi:hypothetical protein